MRQKTKITNFPTVNPKTRSSGLKMGMIFLTILLFLPVGGAVFAQDILLPEIPRKKARPPAAESDDEEILEQRREQRRDEMKAEGLIVEKTSEPRQEKELEVQNQNPGPMRFAWLSSLQFTKVSVSDPKRRDDETSYGIGQHWLFRVSSNENRHQFWAGVRWQNFQGQGFEDNEFISYSWSYWGPSIAYAFIDAAEGQLAPTQKRAAARNALWLSTGVAAQSRTSSAGENRGLVFDSPGLWTELQMHRIHHHALSYGLQLGLQAGQKKWLFSTGIAVGAYY
jgi:hypothetical protein